MTLPRRIRGAAVPMVLTLVVWLSGCSSAPPVPSPSDQATPSPSMPTRTPGVTSGQSPASGSVAETPPVSVPPAPPTAELRVGGVGFPGEAGAWSWAGITSDAPWLPATALDRIVIPAGAELAVAVAGGVAPAGWSATAARADDPRGAEPVGLGEGPGAPTFEPPPPGEWVVMVHVRFAVGGDAAYYWFVDVR